MHANLLKIPELSGIFKAFKASSYQQPTVDKSKGCSYRFPHPVSASAGRNFSK